jgi:hypothetical protein
MLIHTEEVLHVSLKKPLQSGSVQKRIALTLNKDQSIVTG